MFAARRRKILQYAAKIGCKSIISFRPENIFYLTGFWGEGAVLVRDEDHGSTTKLFAPRLEYLRSQKESKECDVIPTERGRDILSAIISEIKNNDWISCIDGHEDFNILEYLKARAGNVKKNKKRVLVNDEPFLKTRIIKDEYEIKAIKKAASIIDTLFEYCIDEIKIGMSEQELQGKLVFEALKNGAGLPFYRSTLNPFIVASGPNSALPHAEVSNRKFKAGDLITVDLTLRFHGYVADATRTFGLSRITSKKKTVYDIVRVSQQRGIDKSGNKIKIGDIDKECREFISTQGYMKEFNHSTGHGIGLDVHEPPLIYYKNQDVLRDNMAITVEPGIYLESKFGVRIEDSIIIDSKNTNGKRNLNKFTKDLIIID